MLQADALRELAVLHRQVHHALEHLDVLVGEDHPRLRHHAVVLLFGISQTRPGKEETEPVARVLAPEERKDIKEMMLRFIVDACDGTHVRMNIPMALLLVALETGVDLQQVSGNSALKNIDLEQIVNLVHYGVMGNLMEVESGEGDIVRVFVE